MTKKFKFAIKSKICRVNLTKNTKTTYKKITDYAEDRKHANILSNKSETAKRISHVGYNADGAVYEDVIGRNVPFVAIDVNGDYVKDFIVGTKIISLDND